MGPVCEQSIYNLSNRLLELEVIPACRDYGMGLVIWSPLAGGLLGGALGKSKEGRRSKISEQIGKYRNQLEAYESFCKKFGEKPADVALAWILRNPVITGPIVGPRTIEQLKGSLRSLDIELSHNVIEELDKIWPGPGGTAPEAYAW